MKCSLDSLPLEVLEKVYENVTDLMDLVKSQRLNRRMYEMCQKKWKVITELKVGFIWCWDSENQDPRLTKAMEPILLINDTPLTQLNGSNFTEKLTQMFDLIPNLKKLVFVQDLSRSGQHPFMTRAKRQRTFRNVVMDRLRAIVEIASKHRIEEVKLVGAPKEYSDTAIPAMFHANLLHPFAMSLQKMSLEIEPTLFSSENNGMDVDTENHMQYFIALEELRVATPTLGNSYYSYDHAFVSMTFDTLRKVVILVRNYDASSAIRGIPSINRPGRDVEVCLVFRKHNSHQWKVSELTDILRKFQLSPKRFALVKQLSLVLGPEDTSEIVEFSKLIQYVLPGLKQIELLNPLSDKCLRFSSTLAECFLAKPRSEVAHLTIKSSETLYLERDIEMFTKDYEISIENTSQGKQVKIELEKNGSTVLMTAPMYAPKAVLPNEATLKTSRPLKLLQKTRPTSAVLDMRF